MIRILKFGIFFGLLISGISTANAQWPTSVPKIPRINKERPKAPNTPDPNINSNNKDRYYDALRSFRFVDRPDTVVQYDRAELISSYLECYAKKHNYIYRNHLGYIAVRQFNQNTNDYGAEMKQTLLSELPKLAELEKEFKKKFPTIPNTGTDNLDENPAIWGEILANREEYYKCAISSLPDQNDCNNLSTIDKVRLDSFKEDIDGTLQDQRSFTKGRDWYVRTLNDSRNEYLWYAISPSWRSRLNERFGPLTPCISGYIDEIAAEAKRSLPMYHPVGFNIRNPAEEEILRSAVNDIAQATVFKIGLGSRTWQIQKNSLGIPENRYKYGVIWAKYPNYDDGYCRIMFVNLIQDYAGGGTYGSSYGLLVRSEPAGCPAK